MFLELLTDANLNRLDLWIRFAIIFYITVSVEICFRARMYRLALFFSALWVTFFKLVLYRAIATYAGVFAYQLESTVTAFRDFVSSPQVSVITDVLVLFAILRLFTWIKQKYRQRLPGNTEALSNHF